MGCPADDRGHVGDCGCDCRRTGPRPLSGRHACRRVIGNVLNHVVETRIVLYARYGEEAVGEFDAMLDGAGIDVVPFDGALARAAFDGFRRYGKGQGHPAQLNIIDCAAYALAKTRNEPLLFKGNDFMRTDVESAI
jgi:ribonuclease VapC